jgi:hypothetical protein
MTANAQGSSALFAGRLLAYVPSGDARVIGSITATSPDSGLMLYGPGASADARALPPGMRQCVGVDVGAWSRSFATVAEPLELPAQGGLFAVSLDTWVAGIAAASRATAVLTPSRMVRAGDWASLRALLVSGSQTSRPQAVLLVAADAEMLDAANFQTFLAHVATYADTTRLAFLFADKGSQHGPVARRERAAAIRSLLAAHPDALLVGLDALVGTDLAARGGSAAVGVTSTLRRPRLPGGKGGPIAADWLPGLLLPDLWECRSPAIYADWYLNAASPTCASCGGRALDRFAPQPSDKAAILAHNVHTWLSVHTEIRRRTPVAAQLWLDDDRRRGLAAHLSLRPANSDAAADRALRSLCELDDPTGRLTTRLGAWI